MVCRTVEGRRKMQGKRRKEERAIEMGMVFLACGRCGLLCVFYGMRWDGGGRRSHAARCFTLFLALSLFPRFFSNAQVVARAFLGYVVARLKKRKLEETGWLGDLLSCRNCLLLQPASLSTYQWCWMVALFTSHPIFPFALSLVKGMHDWPGCHHCLHVRHTCRQLLQSGVVPSCLRPVLMVVSGHLSSLANYVSYEVHVRRRMEQKKEVEKEITTYNSEL